MKSYSTPFYLINCKSSNQVPNINFSLSNTFMCQAILWCVMFICIFVTGWPTFEKIYRHSSEGQITSYPSLDLVHVLLYHRYPFKIPIPNVNDNGQARRIYADIAICEKELNEWKESHISKCLCSLCKCYSTWKTVEKCKWRYLSVIQ